MQNGQNIVASIARVFYVMDGLKNNLIFNFANTRENTASEFIHFSDFIHDEINVKFIAPNIKYKINNI